MQLPVIKEKHSTLRPWHPDDALSLVKHANNPRIASNLRDGFPYPYLLGDAKKWLAMVDYAFMKTIPHPCGSLKKTVSDRKPFTEKQ